MSHISTMHIDKLLFTTEISNCYSAIFITRVVFWWSTGEVRVGVGVGVRVVYGWCTGGVGVGVRVVYGWCTQSFCRIAIS